MADVPLKLVRGYMLAGHAEPPEDDVAAFRKIGTLRAKPLAPSTNALEEIETAVGRLVRVIDIDKAYVFDQALRFFGTVYHPADRRSDTWIPDVLAWKRLRGDIEKLGVSWNAQTEQMELPGGGTLTAPMKTYHRVWWDFTLKNAKTSRVTFERISDDEVDIESRIATAGAFRETIRIVDARTGTVLTLVHMTGQAGVNISSSTLKVPLATQLRPELASGAKGPILAP